ncbi:hypothetical protein AB5I41_18090 [Sphingomonas sp. MMS24-JH45]
MGHSGECRAPRTRPLVALASAVLAAACVPAPAPPPPAPVRSRPGARPDAFPDARGLAGLGGDAGTWTYERDARGSRALFGTPVPTRWRCCAATSPSARSICRGPARATVRTTSATRMLAAQPTGGTPPYAAVALAPRDPLLDAIAFSRGRFTLEQAGTPPLVLRPWAEVARVIEDCRG